jgi:hypothetical protein
VYVYIYIYVCVVLRMCVTFLSPCSLSLSLSLSLPALINVAMRDCHSTGFVLKYFLRWLGDLDLLAWQGYVWATALFTTNLLQAFSFHQAFFWAIRAGIRAKAAMTAVVYDKVLRLNPNK